MTNLVSRLHDDELVVDATRPLQFTVEPNDVAEGKRRDKRDCPGNHGICRALKSVLPNLLNEEIQTALTRTYVRMPRAVATKEFGAAVPPHEKIVWVRFANDLPLRDQVYRMDKHEKFEPGEYKLVTAPTAPRKTERHLTKEHKTKIARAKRGQSYRKLEGVRKWGANR